MKIGNVELTNNIILAPMAGVSDLPFRLLCHEYGAGLVCSEMVSAKAILYNNKNTDELLNIHPDEGPVSLQLFGNDPKIMSEMAARIESRPFAILDINMGCPVPKIVNNHEGSYLMKCPDLVYDIVSAISSAISKPVTVKIRKGFDDTSVNAVEIAKAAEAGGASAVAVHGRTREQYYSGTVDLDIIGRVKTAVKIPVIGNGDITDGPSAQRMLEVTGCDGIMVGRGAQGNPFVFAQIKSYLEGTEIILPTGDEIRNVIRRHAMLQMEYKGEYVGVREMRKHMAWYVTGRPGATSFRRRINEMEKMDDLLALIDEFPFDLKGNAGHE